jgi:spore maturation protein CgeB
VKFSLFYHSLVSDWNHGNAHFLRGIVSELMSRGHRVRVFEPADGWSRENLLRDHGTQPLVEFQHHYPALHSQCYRQDTLDLEAVAASSDVIMVHEWSEPWLVNALGELRRQAANGFRLLFHDTHHRIVSHPAWLKRFTLDKYDGVLAFGEVISEMYRTQGWHDTVWTWHEAADTRVFHPRPADSGYPNADQPDPKYPRGEVDWVPGAGEGTLGPKHPCGEVVWIGNWGDDERARQLEDFLFRPVRELALRCHVYGVRYPKAVLAQLARQTIAYRGWVANFHVPAVFANHRVTVHIPRRYYRECLPGIPTIRPFEAMACGIPLICAPWEDSEHLFTPGEDYLVARNTREMKRHLRSLLHDSDHAKTLAEHALTTIRGRHTCARRVDELLAILTELGLPATKAGDSPNFLLDSSSTVTDPSLTLPLAGEGPQPVPDLLGREGNTPLRPDPLRPDPPLPDPPLRRGGNTPPPAKGEAGRGSTVRTK